MDALSFEEKRKRLFDMLDSAGTSIRGTVLDQAESDVRIDDFRERNPKRHPKKPEVRRISSQESIFKRPERPIDRCLPYRRVPDFKVNPHKWTRYTLEDAEPINDRTNTRAALSFLQELEERRVEVLDEEEKEPRVDAESMPAKITFNRSVKLKQKLDEMKDAEEEEGKAVVVRDSKVCMPEYVVGQKRVEKKRKTREDTNGDEGETSSNRKALKLDHLLEEEDDVE